MREKKATGPRNDLVKRLYEKRVDDSFRKSQMKIDQEKGDEDYPSETAEKKEKI